MKIFLVTSTRADFGLLKNLIFEFKKNLFFDLKIIAAGTHFSKEFGNTYKEIKSSKIKLYKKIIISSKFNNSIDISLVISKHLIEMTKILNKSKPNLMIILGDRYEILAAAIASHISGVPIAHIHGGEVTIGAVDEAFRHSITKMSHIHFVANKIYKNRVIQLGENPKNVFVTGGLGVDSIKNTKLLNKRKIENNLGINFCKKNIIVNFHPETLNKTKIKAQLNELLNALKTLTDTCLIFTGPGADAENIEIKRIIKKFIDEADNAYYFNSLGQKNYLSILKLVDCMIGNSSSGLSEMPTFRKASINLGIRQEGRIKSQSVIDSKIKTIDIIKSIKKVYSEKFVEILKASKNPYGSPGASKKIVNIIKKQNFKKILEKKFYDIKLGNYK
jgi:GDP/UDP-N,N'-diacetylbacillosamine 2-epimerase (hydrolysing)